MQAIDAVLRRAVEAEDLPFVVAMVGNAGGTLYSGAFGEAAAGRPAAEDTVFRLYSMTKAVGATAAMILIERGRLAMDTPVADVLPRAAGLRVLEGFDGDRPRLRAPKTPLTVRHLASHTSGLVYEFWNPDMARYLESGGRPSVLSGRAAGLDYPLVFDPGARWDYGIGIDWLGQVVEAVDGRPIDRFCAEEIFAPLHMADTGFELDAARAARLAEVRMRRRDGSFRPHEMAPPPRPEVYGMGHALYGTAPDYLRFLRMFLNRGALDGRRILSPDGVAHMLANAIGALSVERMTSVAPPLSADVELFPGIRKTHSFGFMRTEEDVPGMRRAGAQGWAGVCNTHYWLDPASDVAAVLMTQSLPFVEPRFAAVYEAYERAVYAHLVGRAPQAA
ncbi:beta-lactamase family protein [Aquibium sp. A9E412]|uniref:serine hydrolase domain-containing protein n=1 Tax=Aquibium sp. A9E412 TaxID=2976767 RepID=UPI0025AF3414|nr:serine hydrolase domain-containing protein [Aquibium sp. A9E412]MDN2566775.1 beta-lactamase family protein [Aquibium sp. A9E412]